GEVPQADGLPEQPNQPASTHQQSCGADQPYVSLLGEGAVQVAASKDAGPVRGPDTRRRLERLGTPNGTRGRSLKNRQTRQDATSSQTSTTSSRVIVGWRSVRSLENSAWFKSWVFQVTVRTVPMARRWRFLMSSDR